LKVKDGTTLPVQLSSVAMEAADKSQGVCRTILTDISERKRAETEKAELVEREQVARAEAERERELDIINQKQAAEALRESEARLRIAIEAAHIGTWDWQIREDRIDWGGEQDRLFGSQGCAERRTFDGFANFLHAEDRERFKEQIRKAIGRGGDCHFEFRVIWPDQSLHWIQAEGRVFSDDEGRPFRLMGILMDTTVRKEAENQLLAIHEEMEARVVERTAELALAITTLKQEVAERKQAQEARQLLFRELVTTQEEERRRISRELHDQMGQHLTALILGLKSLETALKGPPEIKQLRDLQGLSDDIGRQVHRIAFELRPTALDDLGLQAVLVNYIDEWSNRCGVTVDFHSGGIEKERLPSEIETTIYRIIQEALTNVVKHAKASHLSLILVRREDHLLTIIEDNGKGFDVDEVLAGSVARPHRLGLLGMKERVMLAGGTFELESSPGLGAALFIRIPLPNATKESSTI